MHCQSEWEITIGAGLSVLNAHCFWFQIWDFAKNLVLVYLIVLLYVSSERRGDAT